METVLYNEVPAVESTVAVPLIALREARVADVDECGRILYDAFERIAGHHGFPPDFPSVDLARGLVKSLIARPDVYGVIAHRHGRVLGSNFLWEGDRIAGVGPITVDPTDQNEGVGKLLMSAVLKRASRRKLVGVRLVQAAYHNRSLALYTKLGFEVCEPLSVMQGRVSTTTMPGREVRVATEADISQCSALGVRLQGYDRRTELENAVSVGAAMIVQRNGRTTGYSSEIGFFGHSVAETDEDLMALIGAATEIAGPGFLLPTRNARVLRWCLARGLRIVQPMTLMRIGEYRPADGAWLPSVLY